jgi:hypothetical protein
MDSSAGLGGCGVVGGGGGGGVAAAASAPWSGGDDLIGGGGGSPFAKWRSEQSRKFQIFLDRSTPHTVPRWLVSLAVAFVYCLRVYFLQGFYIVTYGLGIYLLNLLIGFLSPQIDMETEGPSLPSKGSDEFKPFIRRLPEFKFWYVDLSLTTRFSLLPAPFYLLFSTIWVWRFV